MKLFVPVLLAVAYARGDNQKVPMYKYRYETEDVMKSAASNIPLHGYHVVEGGYYPEERIGRSAGGFGGYSSQGGGSFGGGYSSQGGGLGGGYSSQGISGGGLGGGYSSQGISGGGLGRGYSSQGISGGGLGGGYSSQGISGGGYSSQGISGGGLGGGYSSQGFGRGIGRRYQNEDIGYGGGSLGGAYVNPRFTNSGAGIGRLGGGFGIGGGSDIGIGVGGLHHGKGGEILDKSVYDEGKKNLNDESYEKIDGKKGEEINKGEQGFSQGKVGLQNSKGDSGYYKDEEGGKKIVEDGKSYSGGEFYNQEGKNADEKKEKSGHKKGHVVKGFKSSHHKDETGRTEEYYDEAHDEGDKFNVQGKSGKFGEDSQASYKGGHDNSKFNADERKKQGHYDSEEFANKNNADQGEYGQKKYIGNGQVYGANNGIDQQSLLGHHESSRIFKHHPHYVPFYH